MAKDKLKMSNKRFLIIMVPILVVLLAAIIVVTAVMNFFAPLMDAFLGKGTRHIMEVEGTSDWDTQFYDVKYDSYEDAIKASTAAAKRIADEGIILMKNSAPAGKTTKILPLAEKAKVTPFGFRYNEPVYGIYGSGSINDGMAMEMIGGTLWDDDYKSTNPESIELYQAIENTFTVNTTVTEKTKNAEYNRIDAAEGTIPCQEITAINGCAGSNTYLYEYAASVYSGTESSCADTTGLVFIGRDSSEGGDLKLDGYADGTPHQLTLSSDEKATIKFAKENCTNGVVAVINACNVMELDELVSGEYAVDAIVWMGYPGSNGSQSLADILCGKVNPSGRTVNAWVSDLTADPSYANMGTFVYDAAEVEGSHAVGNSFVEYEEGIYVGYKYYETADAVDPDFDYDSAVVFPFGHGLSYTEFEQTLDSCAIVGENVEVRVTVKNKGDIAGKEVVQLYYAAPYTEFDRSNNIEKSVKNLVAFDKVEVAANDSETVTLTFPVEDMASYCYTRDNGDGTRGAYVLEEGDYEIYLGKNSHESWDSATVTLGATEWFDNSNPRQSEKDGQSLLDDNGEPLGVAANAELGFIAATNRFEDSNDYMTTHATILTRKDWANTQPKAPEGESFTAPEAVCDAIDHYSATTFDYQNDPLLGNVEGSAVYQSTAPVSAQDNGMVLSDMRGLDYYDDSWDLLLDQIDYSKTDEIVALLYGGAYNLGGLDSIGMAQTRSAEGPSGFGLFAHLFYGDTRVNKLNRMCGYPAGTVLASTWDPEMAYLKGSSIGQEAFWFIVSEGTYLNGWTGPSMNLQRNAFNGRNAEYYSEDPVLAGEMGAREISGAGDSGLYTIFKHFAMNNIETAKTLGGGICTWATEQAMRESYFKVFETVFKDARREVKYIADDNGTVATKIMRGATAVMTSFNRIGAVPSGSNYALITELLKREWGFQGFVQTDMPSQSNKDQMLRAGGSVEMNSGAAAPADLTSPTAQHQIRRAVHDIAFAVVNSSAMQGVAPGSMIYYDMSPWAIILMIANIVVYALILAGLVWIALRLVDARRHPEKYKGSGERI